MDRHAPFPDPEPARFGDPSIWHEPRNWSARPGNDHFLAAFNTFEKPR